jgi:hypothetical protein
MFANFLYVSDFSVMWFLLIFMVKVSQMQNKCSKFDVRVILQRFEKLAAATMP